MSSDRQITGVGVLVEEESSETGSIGRDGPGSVRSSHSGSEQGDKRKSKPPTKAKKDKDKGGLFKFFK